MHHDLSLQQTKKEWHGTIRSYLLGLGSSLVLTVISFAMVALQLFSPANLMMMISALALIQAVCQLRWFLHIGEEAKPRWETLVFFFMLLILLIITLGSLWIMWDLNVRTMHAGMHS
jgi:cytochrome o ubiquinol oxidase subunit IV